VYEVHVRDTTAVGSKVVPCVFRYGFRSFPSVRRSVVCTVELCLCCCTKRRDWRLAASNGAGYPSGFAGCPGGYADCVRLRAVVV
jgi:hypothetical protein